MSNPANSLSDEQLDALAKKHTTVRDQTTHGWGTVPVAKLDHRAFARDILAVACGVTDTRTCTCHPDDNPPKPCPRKFSLNECRAAGGVEGKTK